MPLDGYRKPAVATTQLACLHLPINIVPLPTASPVFSSEPQERYVLLPAPNVTLEVDLICAIQPGVLSGSYHVEWDQLEPKFRQSSIEMYNITDNVTSEEIPSVPTEYRCTVAVQHSSNENMDYNASVVFQKKGENPFSC